MPHVNALSRVGCIYVIKEPLLERLARAQQRDENLEAIHAALGHGNFKDYTLKGNLLFKGTAGQEKLVVPRGMQKDLVQCAHEKGHFGIKKTMEHLQKEYYVTNMKKRVEECIQNCLTCILASRKLGKPEGLLTPIPKHETPMHTLHMDHVGPLPSTRKSYKYILVITDGFSKFTWIFASKSTGATEVIKKFEILQQHFGNPRRIISDRGTAFTSAEFNEYCEEQKIQHLSITTGVPRGNGQVGRVNGVAEATFAKLAIEEPLKWFKYVSRVQRALNGSFQRAIGTSPFELMLGIKLKSPEDTDLIELIKDAQQNQFEESRSELRSAAKLQIEKIQAEHKKTYDKKRKEATKYRIGDIVAIRRTQQSPGLKLLIKFLGPYRVIKVAKHDRYEVEKLTDEEGPSKTTTSADNMKPWRRFADDFDGDESATEDNEDCSLQEEE